MFDFLMSDREYRQRRMLELVNPGIFDEPVEPPDTVLLTEKETAELLGVCTKTVWNLRDQGKLAVVKIGTSVRYSKRDVLAFIESTKSAGQQDQGE